MTQKIKARQFMAVQDLDKLSYDLTKLKDILSGLKAKEIGRASCRERV